MAVNDQSVATDLAALLRESLNDDVDLTAKTNIPVQLATAPIGFTPPGAPAPSYASVHPNGPPSGIRPATGYEASEALQLASQPLTMPTPLASVMPAMPIPLSMRSSVPVAQANRPNVGLIVGAFLGVVLLAGAAGGAFAWYKAKQVVAPAVAVTPTVAPTPVVAPPVTASLPEVAPPTTAAAAEAEPPAPAVTHPHSATAPPSRVIP